MAQQTPPYVISAASHSAALFRQAFAASFTRYGALSAGAYWVAQQATPNMSVQVGPGRAVIPGTQAAAPTNLQTGTPFSWTPQGAYFGLNDASATVTLAASDPTNARIDVVYVAVQDAFYSGSNNQAVLAVATGTPSASPAVPAIPANAVAVAQVAVAASASSIVNANINNVGSAATALAIATGGILPVTGVSGYPANPSRGVTVHDPLLGQQTWDGAAWRPTTGGNGVLQAHQNGTTNITSSGTVWTSVIVDTVDINPNGWSTGASGFLVPATGLYFMIGLVSFSPSGSASGSRGARFANGSTGIASSTTLYPGFVNTGSGIITTSPTIISAAAGDGIFLQALQNSGSTIATNAGQSVITAIRVG